MVASVSERTVDSSQAAILAAAARCFHARGYQATSIDDVARSLKATKGRIYHYFPSKADLFAEVFRSGMEMNYAALEPLTRSGGSVGTRWQNMARAHVDQMISTQPFQRVVWMGVEMHLVGATTPQQRTVFEELIAARSRYGDLFRHLIAEGQTTGVFSFENLSIANQLMFMTLNSPIFWYSPRAGETPEDVDDLVTQVVTCAWRGLGGKEGDLR